MHGASGENASALPIPRACFRQVDVRHVRHVRKPGMCGTRRLSPAHPLSSQWIKLPNLIPVASVRLDQVEQLTLPFLSVAGVTVVIELLRHNTSIKHLDISGPFSQPPPSAVLSLAEYPILPQNHLNIESA